MTTTNDSPATLDALLREEMAWNAHNDDEKHLRCSCDECIAAVREPLVKLYAELADAAKYLPLVSDAMPGGPVVGEIVIARFSRALHRLHVMVGGSNG